MVNRSLLETATAPPETAPAEEATPRANQLSATRKPPRSATRALAEILGKFYFLALRENLPRILLNYAPKCARPANAAFNGAC
jgi:hypothetical protein